MLDLSMILTAKDWPEIVSVASLTLAELPSPRVLPSSYFPTRIPFVTIQVLWSEYFVGLRKWSWDWAMNLCMWLLCIYRRVRSRRRRRNGGRILERRTRHFSLLPPSPFFSGNYSIGLYSLFFLGKR